MELNNFINTDKNKSDQFCNFSFYASFIGASLIVGAFMRNIKTIVYVHRYTSALLNFPKMLEH